MANTTLSETVADILGRSTITETLLVLPPGQLERKLYESVAKAIKLAGGKWNTSKQGFVFASDPRAKLGLALETGVVVDEKKLRQAYYTPADLANEVARIADVEGKVVLEPSAGAGALVFACLNHGATQVDCIEMEESCRENLIGMRRCVTIADFLQEKPYRSFERIVMNPPYSKGQDVRHVTHAKAWLAPGGTLHAIVPAKDCPKLSALGAVTVCVFPAGSFKESGTGIETRLIRITA